MEKNLLETGHVVKGRTVARLWAIKALYQIELLNSDPNSIVDEFLKYRIDRVIDGNDYAKTDKEHFKWLVLNISSNSHLIDSEMIKALQSDWTIERLGVLLRIMLRAGTSELISRHDIPVRVVVNEYVDLATAFFFDREPAFVNAALDALARRLRTKEFGANAEVKSDA